MMGMLRTARLPADMVAVEQDSESATTEELVQREQMLQAKKKEIQVNVILYIFITCIIISKFMLYI